MTPKQLQSLISAGVFSAALLSGAAYADDTGSPPAKPVPAAHGAARKHKKTAIKKSAAHMCAGENACKGQGGCATDGSMAGTRPSPSLPQHACKGQNACKGQGGCASG
jgi:hypothetical protein